MAEAKEAVMGRVLSRDAQGCLPVDGPTLAADTALFDGIDLDTAVDAVWALIHEGILSCDFATDMVDYGGGR